MKRFSLLLPSEDYDAFRQAYPDYGERTSMLRKIVKRLVNRARSTGRVWNTTLDEEADRMFNEKEREVTP